jgi:hypothetical protein
MTNSPLSCRLLVLLCAAIAAWTFILSLALKLLFGAGVTGGWLIAGIMCSVLFGGLILMMREIKESFLSPSPLVKEPCRRNPLRFAIVSRAASPGERFEHFEGSYAALRRSTLGLGSRHDCPNRRRSARCKRPPQRETALAA